MNYRTWYTSITEISTCTDKIGRYFPSFVPAVLSTQFPILVTVRLAPGRERHDLYMVKKFFLRLLTFLLTFTMMLGLVGCGPTSSIIRYDISQAPKSFDPQFASGETEQMVIYNIFEGLVRQKPSGEIILSAAATYEVSDDKKQYTFTLRPGMTWDDNRDKDKKEKEPTPVTANDFVFAFQRIFNQISPSPYVQLFSSLKNSAAVLAGELPPSQLGVTAPDSLTVRFELEYPDPIFLENLAHSSAMPCNQQLFELANGKYGSNVENTYCNGPFQLYQWDNATKIYMKRNALYYDVEAVKNPGVFLMFNRDKQTDQQKETNTPAPTRFELVLDGKSDCCEADYTQAQQAKQKGLSSIEIDGTVWALVYNQNNPTFSNQNIRIGFTRAINTEPINTFLTENNIENLHPTSRLIPPAISLFTEPYTESSTVDTVNTFSTEAARTAYQAGLEELGLYSLANMEILVPEDSNIPDVLSLFQQNWQQALSVFVNIVPLPRDELMTRIRTGDYRMALLPLQSATNSPDNVLQKFTSGSTENYTGFHNEEFDAFLMQASQSHDKQTILDNYASAEEILLNQAVAIPLLTEKTYFIIGKDVSGVEFFPYGGRVYFKDAQALR